MYINESNESVMWSKLVWRFEDRDVDETEHCVLEGRKVNLLETHFKIAWHD